MKNVPGTETTQGVAIFLILAYNVVIQQKYLLSFWRSGGAKGADQPDRTPFACRDSCLPQDIQLIRLFLLKGAHLCTD